MITIEKKEKCCGCAACANVCPVHCIDMLADYEGFLYPDADVQACINCGRCERVCPELNFTEITNNICQSVGCKSKDDNIRSISSSGGIYFFLSRSILFRNGIVVAPVFDDCFYLRHQIIRTEGELRASIGSKYVQSDVGSVLSDVKEYLKNDKLVYFSGTPCQISGLKHFLGREYETLITQDIICHGAPSPKLWERHIKYIQSKENDLRNIALVNFRDKTNGWRSYSLKVSSADGSEYCEQAYKEPYLKVYSRNLSSRPACFSCPFKGVERESDITLGDFWGMENIVPTFDDDKGTTLVIIHTEKGKRLFDSVRTELFSMEVEPLEALKYNRAALAPVIANVNREEFFNDINNKGYVPTIKKYSADSFLTKTKRMIKKMISI